ncbi:MAG: glycosyltransferase [Chloroflexota bacterium]|nr:glycosyltransferase [Chloroflexota bacterium]
MPKSAGRSGEDLLPRISVVMAVYNAGEYLRQSIDSILEQTYRDFEFLIIDDGSTDDTGQILASYDDPRTVILGNEQNRGLAASLNRGLAVAGGEYVARQDADDVSYPRRLAKQVAYLDAHPEAGVVGTTTEWIDENDDVLQVWHQPTENGAIQETLLKYCCLIHGSTMYRRRCFEEMGGYDPAMRTGQDYDFWLRVSEAWDLANLPDVLYRYRWHDAMTSERHGVQQDRNADLGLSRALQRRKQYARALLGSGGDRIPRRVRDIGRRRLAQRYVWWSAGARSHGRALAFYFLLVSFLLDPTTPDIWRYVAGILQRKAGMRNADG